MKLRKRRSVSGQYAESSNSDPDYVDEDVKEKTPKRVKQQKARSSKKTKRGRERKSDSKDSVTDDSSSQSSSESFDYNERTPNHKQKKQKRKRSSSKKDKRTRKYHSDDEDDSSEATVENDKTPNRSDNDDVSDNVTSSTLYYIYLLHTEYSVCIYSQTEGQSSIRRSTRISTSEKKGAFQIPSREERWSDYKESYGAGYKHTRTVHRPRKLADDFTRMYVLFIEKICLSFFVKVAASLIAVFATNFLIFCSSHRYNQESESVVSSDGDQSFIDDDEVESAENESDADEDVVEASENVEHTCTCDTSDRPDSPKSASSVSKHSSVCILLLPDLVNYNYSCLIRL